MNAVAGRLPGKVAVVTGAGQGLGRGIAEVLSDAGAAVALLGRTESKLTDTARELAGRGADVLTVRCDVAIRTDTEAAVAATLEKFGRIDILVNNAQGGKLGVSIPTAEISDDDVLEFLHTGPLGALHMMQACFTTMRDAGGGTIVNLGSAIGVRGTPRMAGYAMAKEAIGALTKVTATEWGKHNIRVNAVCPAGMSPTAQAFKEADPDRWEKIQRDTPLRRLGDPYDDIGRAVLALVSDDMQYLTGATLMLDGGQIIQR